MGEELIVRKVACPGSFDPVTNGHLDIVGRAAALFDEVTVVIAINQNKAGLFTVEERLELLREVTAKWSNVRVDSFQGLLVDFCRDRGIPAVWPWSFDKFRAEMRAPALEAFEYR